MRTGKFTVNEVEERTKVPASTLRQWERRYGFPKPERSDAGYRLYSEVDLGYIDAMKRHIAEGIPASRAAQLVRTTAPVPPLPQGPQGAQADLAQALASFDESRAGEILGSAFSMQPFERVVEELVVGTGHLLRRQWDDGGLEGAVVKSAESYLQGRLRWLLSQAPDSKRSQPVFTAGAPGSDFELAPLALTLFVRRAGLRASYLGSNVALRELHSISERFRPAVIVVHASERWSLAALAADWWRLRQSVATLAVAGTAPVPVDPRIEMSFEHLGEGLSDSVARLTALLATVSHAPIGGQ